MFYPSLHQISACPHKDVYQYVVSETAMVSWTLLKFKRSIKLVYWWRRLFHTCFRAQSMMHACRHEFGTHYLLINIHPLFVNNGTVKWSVVDIFSIFLVFDIYQFRDCRYSIFCAPSHNQSRWHGPPQRQAITWSIDDPIHRRYASLGFDEVISLYWHIGSKINARYIADDMFKCIVEREVNIFDWIHWSVLIVVQLILRHHYSGDAITLSRSK